MIQVMETLAQMRAVMEQETGGLMDMEVQGIIETKVLKAMEAKVAMEAKRGLETMEARVVIVVVVMVEPERSRRWK